MGLFDTTKKVYVSSVAYNMAGPVEDRPDFLQALVLESVVTSSPSIADDVVKGEIQGPGIDQRSFYRWAREKFPEGKCQGRVTQAKNVSKAVVEDQIAPPAGGSVVVKAAWLDMGEISYWAERWLLNNDPGRFQNAWVAEFDPGPPKQVVISFPSGSVVRADAGNFSSNAKYIYAYYDAINAAGDRIPRVFIYRMGGSNAALNALDVEISVKPEVFPVIPLRLDNKMISHPDFAGKFPKYSKAYKKAVGKPVEELLDLIRENDNLGDIDYAFMVHGVELNTPEKAGRRYLYEFLRNLIPEQSTSPLELANWLAASLGYTTQKQAVKAWKLAQENPGSPLYGTPRPTTPKRQDLEVSRFEVKTTSNLRYEAHLGWVTIEETVGTGKGKPGAKTGAFWFDLEPDIEIPGVMIELSDGDTETNTGSLGRFKLYWQETSDIYRVLTCYGLFHENFVYDGKTVTISAREALIDDDVTGFIVPLHYPTLVSIPLNLSNQLSISNRILVFNCYEVVKQRWYQTSWFRFVLVLVVAAVTAFLAPAAAGILGTNLAVGTALGLTGTAALVVGGIANALAAMALTMAIESGATTLFGEEVGTIISALATVMAMQYAMSFQATGSMSFSFGDMFRAENLMKLTDALTGGIQKWAGMQMRGMQEDLLRAQEEYEEEREEIERRSIELLGAGNALINPLIFLETNGVAEPGSTGISEPESSQTFLTRTLLLGSDIAEMSLAAVKNYPELALELPKPFA